MLGGIATVYGVEL